MAKWLIVLTTSHDNLEIAGSILVVFNFCALNQTTESVQSVQVRAKCISARTPHGVHAESMDCASLCGLAVDSIGLRTVRIGLARIRGGV